MNHLDLFSGIGGFALAARWSGIETMQFVENDKFCQKVLEKNFPSVPIHDDIKTFDATNLHGKIDILTGGFPCQPFSVAGKKQGCRDDRYLWPEMFRIIRECKPTWIIAENVPGIIPMLDPILEDLEKESYDWRSYLIPASAIGAPHKRERLWIIAHCDSERFNDGLDHWQERYIQSDINRITQKIHAEWPQFVPESWSAFSAEEFITSDTMCHHGNKGTEDYEAYTERSERSDASSEIGIIAIDADCIASPQADSGINAGRSTGETWNVNPREYRQDKTLFNWEKDKPPIPGVDDGLPNGLDRNKALGNAIVPQVVYPFMKMIYLMEKNKYLLCRQ